VPTLREDPSLLRVFLQPLLELQVDPNTAVRKTIATLCEQIGVNHPEFIAPCVGAIRTLLKDAVPMVRRRGEMRGIYTLKSLFNLLSVSPNHAAEYFAPPGEGEGMCVWGGGWRLRLGL
jgi:hypothetical protein